MSAVLWRAANMEDRTDDAHDVIARLQTENRAMRELLELLNSADMPTGTEAQKPPSSDAAIQTHSPSESDPFCTGDFATIRPRPPSSGSPPSAKHCSAGNNVQNSPHPRNQENEDLCSQFPPSSSSSPGNSADVSSNALSLSNDAPSSHAVADVDCVSADETGHVNSSESSETLVNPSELSENDEC